MIKLIKNKLWVTIFLVTVYYMFDFPKDFYNHKLYVFSLLYIAETYLVYYRGYFSGREYYRKPNNKLRITQDKGWDHKQTLEQLIEEHPFCYLELEYPDSDDFPNVPKPNPSGVIHLLQNQKRYISISLAMDNHWEYFGDSLISRDILAKGQYVPMLTKEAVRVAVSKNWDLYF